MNTPDPTAITRSTGPSPAAIAAALTLIAGIISVGAAAGAYVLSSLQARTNQETTVKIADTEKQISANAAVANELAVFTKRAELLEALFSAQKAWPAVLGSVEQRLYKTMTVTSLQLKSTGEVVLSGSVPTYDDYARFYTSLVSADGQRFFSLVKPGQVSRQLDGEGKPTGAVQSSFTLMLQPAVLNALETQTVESLATK